MMRILRGFVRRHLILQRCVAHARARWIARKHPEGLAPPVPRRVIVEPTNACNLACVYCGNKDMLRPATYLDLGVYEELLDQMVALGIPRLTLHTIGEPTLHPQVARMLAMAVERERCVMMSTNGTLLDEDLARAIVRASPDVINVSVDAADQDVLKVLRPGLKLERLLANLRTFRRIRDEEGRVRASPQGPMRMPTISVTCVLTRFFTRAVERRFFDAFRELVDDFEFHHANNHGDYVHEDPSAPRHMLPARLRDAIYGRIREACHFPWDALYLLSDGTISVCRFDFDARVKVGRFPEQGIAELWNCDAMRDLRRAHLAFDFEGWSQCRDCTATLYSSRDEHLALTRRILRRNGFVPRRSAWLPVDPRRTAARTAAAQVDLADLSPGLLHGGARRAP